MKHGKLMDCEKSMMAIRSINHDITNLVRNNSNCNIVMSDCNKNNSFNSTNIENYAQNMVGRMGPIWNFRWVDLLGISNL
jgi:hypothetical protein